MQCASLNISEYIPIVFNCYSTVVSAECAQCKHEMRFGQLCSAPRVQWVYGPRNSNAWSAIDRVNLRERREKVKYGCKVLEDKEVSDPKRTGSFIKNASSRLHHSSSQL